MGKKSAVSSIETCQWHQAIMPIHQLHQRQSVNSVSLARNVLAEKYIDKVGRRIHSHEIFRDKVYYYIIVCAGHYAASPAPEIMPTS